MMFGNDYFLCTGNNDTGKLLDLLKAFSIFKKMQKSNMQLLIIPGSKVNKEFSEALRLYKFRSEVKVSEHISRGELACVTAGAYGIVYPFINGKYLPALEAMTCNVPVITAANEEITEVCMNAALYVNNDHRDLADKMMLIFKDENLRHQLTEKGREQVKKYTWDNSAETFWRSIEKAAY